MNVVKDAPVAESTTGVHNNMRRRRAMESGEVPADATNGKYSVETPAKKRKATREPRSRDNGDDLSPSAKKAKSNKLLPKVSEKGKSGRFRRAEQSASVSVDDKCEEAELAEQKLNKKPSSRAGGKKKTQIPGKAVEQHARESGERSAVTDGDIASLLRLGEDARATRPPVALNHDSDDSEWEAVDPVLCHPDLDSKGFVEVTLPAEAADLLRAKKKQKVCDVEAYVRRQIVRTQRELQALAHHCHVLCLLARSRLLNLCLNDADLMAVTLSLVPSRRALPPRPLTVTYLQALVDWFAGRVQLSAQAAAAPDAEGEPLDCARAGAQLHAALVVRRVARPLLLTALLVLVARALGLECRLVAALHPLPLKPRTSISSSTAKSTPISSSSSASARQLSVEQRSVGAKSSTATAKSGRKDTGSGSRPPPRANSSALSQQSGSNLAANSPRGSAVRRNSTRCATRQVSYRTSDAETDSDSDEFVGYERQSPKKSSDRSTFRAVSSSKTAPQTHSPDSEQQPRATVKSGEESAPGLPRHPRDVGQESADFWTEIYVEQERRWVPADVISRTVDNMDALRRRCTSSALYVVGWDNCGRVKDLTPRYDFKWSTASRALRASDSWWAAALKPWTGQLSARDRLEQQQLEEQLEQQPFPKTISEFKNHPLYALQRHFLKFEALYPATAAPLGYIGKGEKKEPIYSRHCVVTLHSRDTWLKQARVVGEQEQPYRVLKARPKWDRVLQRSITDRPLEVFGHWQTGPYQPPTAVNGKVPRNDYGNVELFKPCMLPKGTVHLPIEGLGRVARKLDIDCAPAMVGWDFHGGGSHPVFQGYVVCEEFERVLMDAWDEEQREARRRELQKREKRVLLNWKRLIRGLMIKKKLASKYGFGDAKSTESADTAAGNPEKAKDKSAKTASTGSSAKRPSTSRKRAGAAAVVGGGGQGTGRALEEATTGRHQEEAAPAPTSSERAQQVEACLAAMSFSKTALSSESEADDDDSAGTAAHGASSGGQCLKVQLQPEPGTVDSTTLSNSASKVEVRKQQQQQRQKKETLQKKTKTAKSRRVNSRFTAKRQASASDEDEGDGGSGGGGVRAGLTTGRVTRTRSRSVKVNYSEVAGSDSSEGEKQKLCVSEDEASSDEEQNLVAAAANGAGSDDED